MHMYTHSLSPSLSIYMGAPVFYIYMYIDLYIKHTCIHTQIHTFTCTLTYSQMHAPPQPLLPCPPPPTHTPSHPTTHTHTHTHQGTSHSKCNAHGYCHFATEELLHSNLFRNMFKVRLCTPLKLTIAKCCDQTSNPNLKKIT